MNNSRITDARVAEIVGYEAWEKYSDHKGNPVDKPFMVLRAPGNVYGANRSVESLENDGYSKCSLADWIDVENMPAHLLRFPPFTTAPTFETDGIVLEWVQGRAEMIFEMQFCNSVREIVSGREEDEPVKERYYLNFFLRHYKPGDYASALLEVISK